MAYCIIFHKYCITDFKGTFTTLTKNNNWTYKYLDTYLRSFKISGFFQQLESHRTSREAHFAYDKGHSRAFSAYCYKVMVAP